MGGYNPSEPLIPRLREVVERLFDLGHDKYAEDIEEAIAVLENRLALDARRQQSKPCPVCGGTDLHIHTSGPFGMSE